MNAPTKHWAFSEETQIWKIRIFWIELIEKNFLFLFQAVFVFDFSKNMNPRLYILVLVDKSMT